jgi:four helix bundle suffix protein
LIKQEDYLLHQWQKSISERFMREGGVKEKMHRLRKEQIEKDK